MTALAIDDYPKTENPYYKIYHPAFVRDVHRKRREQAKAEQPAALTVEEKAALVRQSAAATMRKVKNDPMTVEQLQKMDVDAIIEATINSEGISRKELDKQRGNALICAVRRLAVLRVYRAYGDVMSLREIGGAFGRSASFAMIVLDKEIYLPRVCRYKKKGAQNG